MSAAGYRSKSASLKAQASGGPLGTWLDAGYYLTVAMAATELDITVAAVNDAVKRGRIVGVKVGGRRLIASTEVERYRDTRKASSAATTHDLEKARDVRLARKAGPARRVKKPTVVYYPHGDGRRTRMTPAMARSLRFLEGLDLAPLVGRFVNEVEAATWFTGTSRDARRLLSALLAPHLVYYLLGRDTFGGRVQHVRLSLSGRDALRYCIDRSLI
ncbi:hypothetical protein LCGC14_1186710 [marine sediment metagenome]|uniref:Helix-turn-helix domain-containing protein n=1 Tax=marine sediment metagenome TaxID=412755 RepID=A0A0F9LQD4_9ZZZZ